MGKRSTRLCKRSIFRLKSGSGKKVTSRKQAIAIGLSEARKKGTKVPRKPLQKRRQLPKIAAFKKNPDAVQDGRNVEAGI